ncbi:hypothetical protein CANMA_003149 [Candida margitis]|uniref:uncharacterized protein n=1 Tax=Candida margitis TaxID=1775924 RepID=UPI0022278820|nr:uncharacterized protein CANMA_003149 [Candida margitis]KAI5967329.1 hypothetical protein CANMA_003149 [Candida margitis]
MSDVPLTPPRRSKKHSTFTTPNQYALLTPATSTKKPKNFAHTSGSANRLSLVTPNTPQKSPSKFGIHRKRNLNDIFTESNTLASEKLPMGLFLPSPHIVGSGRNGKHLPVTNRTEVRETPSTPTKQVIDEDTVRQWHDNSDDNDEEEEEVEVTTWEETQKIPKAKLPNPFLTSTDSSFKEDKKEEFTLGNLSNPFLDNKETKGEEGIDYNTHMELINNKTGQRKVVKLTKNQMKIKPKKLSFEGM